MSSVRIPFVEARQLTRIFDRDYALHRVDVRLEAGGVHLVLGPNGAGKSTLLSILATLDKPTSGEVRFGPDLDFEGMARAGRGRLGYVAHDSLVYGDLTGHENLAFYARLYRLGDRQRRVTSALALVGLTDVSTRPVRAYSRGMRQRLSIARALINRPDVLILDEPFTGLDRSGRGAVLRVLAGQRDEGRTVILSTHVLDLPPGFADQVVILRRGKVRYAGPVEVPVPALYERVLRGEERSRP